MANELARIVARSSGDPGRDGQLQEAIDLIDARSVPYTPAVSGNWVSPAPSTVGQALDRIAARLTTSGTPP